MRRRSPGGSSSRVRGDIFLSDALPLTLSLAAFSVGGGVPDIFRLGFLNNGFLLFVNFELESLIVEGKPDPTIPEPATAALVALGLTAACRRARCRRGFFPPAR